MPFWLEGQEALWKEAAREGRSSEDEVQGRYEAAIRASVERQAGGRRRCPAGAAAAAARSRAHTARRGARIRTARRGKGAEVAAKGRARPPQRELHVNLGSEYVYMMQLSLAFLTF